MSGSNNPYESPQAASPAPALDPHRPIGIVGWIVIVPIALLASAIAFVCTCFPLAIVAPGGGVGFYFAWICGIVVGGAIGMLVGSGLRLLIRAMRRKRARWK